MHYVDCDACTPNTTLYCEKCQGWGSIPVPEAEQRKRSFAAKAFLLILWLAVVFVVAWEFLGWLARFK